MPEQFIYKEQGGKQELSEIHSVSTTCSLASLANKDDIETNEDAEKDAKDERPVSETLQESSDVMEEDSEVENIDENDANHYIQEDTLNSLVNLQVEQTCLALVSR